MRDIGTIKHTLEIQEKFNLNAKKNFGQNFLVDVNVINKIANCAKIDDQTCVIEIGPGIGSLTEFLARKAKKVIAYDIDERLIEVLAYTLEEYPNVEVRLQDFLTVDLEELKKELQDYSKISLVSNLPYYITSELITKIMLSDLPLVTFVGMMQKEVALKLTGKDQLPLKLLMELNGKVNYEFNVSNQVFIPKPNVDSAVLSVEFHEVNVNKKEFYQFVQAGYKQKRKTLYNNLSMLWGKEKTKDLLEALQIDLKTRAEQLSLEDWIEMGNYLNKNHIIFIR